MIHQEPSFHTPINYLPDPGTDKIQSLEIWNLSSDKKNMREKNKGCTHSPLDQK